MKHDLLLLSKNDIPLVSAGISIHQPSIKEIAYMGEDSFFMACEAIKISKNMLNIQDNSVLDNITDFDIFMQVMVQPVKDLKKVRSCVNMLFELLFPNYTFSFDVNENAIIFQSIDDEDTENKRQINSKNFPTFKAIISSMFCLKTTTKEYDPDGEMAKRIVEQLKKRHQKLAQLQGGKKTSILSRYISILAVGLGKNVNDLMEYSMYQLFDEFERFQLKISYDMYVSAKMAGAKGLEEVDNWMKDIHE